MRLRGLTVAILATDGFEQVELIEPRKALEDAGATTRVVAPAGDQIRGWAVTNWGITIDVDVEVRRASPSDFDALLLPGGVLSPDKLRQDAASVSFARTFFDSGKPVAAICHGPQTLIEAGVLRGRHMTSYSAIRTDLENAGAVWVDQPVVIDGNLLTSRNPDDIPDFNQAMVNHFAQNVHSPSASPA